MRLLIITFLSFLVLVSYQNCGQVSENVAGTEDLNQSVGGGEGDINCLAIATNDLELGFLFGPEDSPPQKYQVKINGALVYSSCSENNEFMSNGTALPVSAAVKSDKRFHIYRSYDKAEDLYSHITIELSGANTCGDSWQEIDSYSGTINYETYSLCGTEGLRAKIDYVVNP